ncbi:transcriptional regulator [Microvirga arsenatis]|uniref:CI repressor n=1 Tax=Microvirga arsenatis TaxID=2692265 RepID=A0ABW9YXN2_9HYPH|nr:YdaS family helix-turn-helix protein [Microvirga arsenatis]NBJ13225.1 hypothetical protein [Microvirga arsenatis]NBJ25137.1 hypothetical protein [Microvirga arsenatis]
MSDGLTEAKEKAGGPVGLARLLNEIGVEITSQAISQWQRIPPARVLDVERVTGVSRYELRPDLYPPPTDLAPPGSEVSP